MVKEDLETEPELFTQSWLLGHVDEDKFIDDLKGDIRAWVEESPESYTSFIDDEEPEGKDGEYSEDQIGKMVEGYLDDIKTNIIGFLEELGCSGKDLAEKLYPYINIDEAVEDAIATDGWQHFLARYDGKSYETKSDYVYWRIN